MAAATYVEFMIAFMFISQYKKVKFHKKKYIKNFGTFIKIMCFFSEIKYQRHFN